MDERTPFDAYFELKEEPVRSCLLALRAHVNAFDTRITEAWKYRMPFFCINGKMFCYAWVDRKTGQPYLGIVEGRKIEHPALVIEQRNRMKILPLDAKQELPVKNMNEVLRLAIAFYN